jgi:hypothetical protein
VRLLSSLRDLLERGEDTKAQRRPSRPASGDAVAFARPTTDAVAFAQPASDAVAERFLRVWPPDARTGPGWPKPRLSLGAMDENKARRVVDALRERGIPAHMASGGLAKCGVRVVLRDGREALWDTDGTAGLEAQVMRDGMLVGYVPVIDGSEDFDEQQVIDAIARTDYDQPIARQRATTPPPEAALPREGGLFRRFLGGFREQ